ncbi:MAG: hypothetical protein K2Y40_19345 [Reyranella sp.]|nr:hypothetical protein [Reyranella sp.]
MKSLLAAAALLVLGPAAYAQEREGMVIDGATDTPIAGAIVTVGQRTVLTDPQGRYRTEGGTLPLQIRAPGYRRETLPAGSGNQDTIRLTPLAPKALYLTVYGIGAPFLLDPALEVIQKSGLNALVIDLKGDRGLIPYPSALPLAAKAGALKLRTIPDLKALATSLKAKGIYLIARIVVFKDDLLVSARPDWAVRAPGGGIWKDREGLAWIDPFRKEAWDYTLSVAEEAAAAGFDEIQFDYVRFPDAAGPAYSQTSTETSRVEAITGFLREAKRRLVPYNVFLAMDSFGYVCWNRNDTGIGQRLEDLATAVDYISPMLYPSGFQFGIPGHTNPIMNIYEIVHRSLEECKSRTAGTTVRYRPWLQAFPDYAFGGQKFGAVEIAKQVKASNDAGTDGWMLWNPRNVYSTDDIKPEVVNDKTPAKR